MAKKKKIKPVKIKFNYCRCGSPIELWQTNCGLGCPRLTRDLTHSLKVLKFLKVGGNEKKEESNFKIDLNKIPNGNKKPTELCAYLKKLRLWREASLYDNPRRIF